MKERAPANAVIALALIHHMVIARNIPMYKFVDRLINLASSGVVELVPKADDMVQKLLLLRQDVFIDYTEENLLKLISAWSNIIKKKQISESGRLLVWYQK